ncbi:hypothetical protein FB451DRAFT_1367155 [Mycena latifolia]|nr:hypothetical protein FB451DRAFT_1367155 [Mycena latifolia]
MASPGPVPASQDSELPEKNPFAALAGNTLTGMAFETVDRCLLFMSPAELLAMHDVNKNFRRLLRSETRATARWVCSREYHGIPAPFEGFDEYDWARFIFGRMCQECYRNESREPDFGLMLRVCIDCRRDKYKWLEVSAPTLYRASINVKHFWEPGCRQMARLMKKGGPRALEELERLRDKGVRQLEYSIFCEEWWERSEVEDRRVKQEILIDRFKALGYQDPELSDLNNDEILSRFRLPLTEHDQRRERLFKDHPDIMKGRQILARDAYQTHASTLLPHEATYLPTLVGLEDIPDIRSICQRESDVDVTGADFHAVPSILANWVATKHTNLAQLAHIPGMQSADCFNLATTIFRCKNEEDGRPAMFGGDEAMRHVGEMCDAQLDKPLSELAAALVLLLRLDPNTASVADMDAHNAWFRCGGRTLTDACSDRGKIMDVFTWRGCITHAIEVHHYGHHKSKDYWRDGTAQFFPYREDPAAALVGGPFNEDLPTVESLAWVCGHCTQFVCGPETFESVTAHVNAVHGKVQLGASDILLAQGVIPISKRCFSVRRKARHNEFRCLKCDDERLFKGERAMRDHLKMRHKILKPVRHTDFTPPAFMYDFVSSAVAPLPASSAPLLDNIMCHRHDSAPARCQRRNQCSLHRRGKGF